MDFWQYNLNQPCAFVMRYWQWFFPHWWIEFVNAHFPPPLCANKVPVSLTKLPISAGIWELCTYHICKKKQKNKKQKKKTPFKAHTDVFTEGRCLNVVWVIIPIHIFLVNSQKQPAISPLAKRHLNDVSLAGWRWLGILTGLCMWAATACADPESFFQRVSNFLF